MLTDISFDESNQLIIKDILTANIKTALVFEKYGINFCCKGNRPIKDACSEKNISLEELLTELNSVLNSTEAKENHFENWNLKFLITYIMNNHHSYVRTVLPQIIPHLEKITSKHDGKYSELKQVKKLFDEVAEEMIIHINKEERILFHVIRYLVDCDEISEKPKMHGFKTVKNPIEKMEAGHTNAGAIMEEIKELTNNFTPPADACETFRLTYKELEEFTKDLHIHVHLENNILFPKAIQLEEDLIKMTRSKI